MRKLTCARCDAIKENPRVAYCHACRAIVRPPKRRTAEFLLQQVWKRAKQSELSHD